MKKICLLCILFIVGCSVKPELGDWFFKAPNPFFEKKLLIPEQVTFNIYSEIGLLQVLKKHIYRLPNVDLDLLVKSALHEGGRQEDGSYIPNFCRNSSLIGGRIFASDEKTDVVDAECLYEQNESNMIGLMSVFFDNSFFVEEKDDCLLVRYIGDSLHIESSNMYGHKKLKEKYVVTKDNEGKTKKVESGSIYEFYLKTNSFVYSVTFYTSLEKLREYKPLRLDPSILPLESPGYKKLREQEEALK